MYQVGTRYVWSYTFLVLKEYVAVYIYIYRPNIPGAYLVHFDGKGSLTRYQFSSIFKKAVDVAGLGKGSCWGTHDLRIGGATWYYLLGHSNNAFRRTIVQFMLSRRRELIYRPNITIH